MCERGSKAQRRKGAKGKRREWGVKKDGVKIR